jgi:uncharacterized repeat protein (TIGR01451 family)
LEKCEIKVRRSDVNYLIFVLYLLLLIIPNILSAQEAWPANADWIPLITSSWELYDDSREGGPGSTDFVSDANGSAAYYASTPTSIFFRMTLFESPLQSPTKLRSFAWSVALDADLDGYLDWLVLLGGKSDILWTFPNTIAYPDNIVDDTEYFALSNPLQNGYIRVSSAASPTYPDAVYLDIQIPYTALQMGGYPRNIDYESTFAMVYGSNTNEDANTVTDVIGNATTFEEALGSVVNYTTSAPESFATIYDTRDPDPYSNAGIWYRNETLMLSGSGWPVSGSDYYNSGQRNIRIINSEDALLWSGVLTTDASGAFTDYPLNTISLSAIPDIYTIWVEDPRSPGSYNVYDSFEIMAPLISFTKSTADTVVSAGGTVLYSIVIQNSGNVAATISTITDLLPEHFSYVSGSSSGLTTADPSISGQQLTWTNNWSIPAGGEVTLDFQTIATRRGTYYNSVTISGGNFALMVSGPTAEVNVSGPTLDLVKSVDKASALPGDTLTYTVNYSNSGDGDATSVIILESIPQNTIYVSGSAAGAGMTVLYSHDGGSSFDSDPTAPVTHLSFQRSAALPPGSDASLTFQVIIK